MTGEPPTMPDCKLDVTGSPVIRSTVWFGDIRGQRFGCILADPPWQYDNESPPCLPEKQPETCVIEYYYPTMGLDEIKAMPVRDVAEKNSVLFLWATCPMLPEAIEVMRAWGWKYKTIVTWEKTNGDCMGYWFRTCTEHLLVGVRGDVKSFRSMTRNLIQCNRGRHSAKPQQAHDIIESVTPDMNRLEIFARLHRPGWTAWGNQVERDLLSPNDRTELPPPNNPKL